MKWILVYIALCATQNSRGEINSNLQKGDCWDWVSRRRLLPPFLVAGLIKEEWRGNGPAWKCGYKSQRTLSQESQVLSVEATRLEIPGGLSKTALNGLVAKFQRKFKERNKTKTNKHQVNFATVGRTKCQCCSRRIARGRKADRENRRITIYQPKGRNYFLDGKIFQVWGGAEFEAPEQWQCFGHKVFKTAVGDLF